MAVGTYRTLVIDYGGWKAIQLKMSISWSITILVVIFLREIASGNLVAISR